MYVILLIALILNSSQDQLSDSLSLIESSKNQAGLYIDNINQGDEVNTNLWALYTLSEDNLEISNYIADKIRIDNYSNRLFRPFLKKDLEKDQLLKILVLENGVKPLLIELLLREPNLAERRLLKRKFSQSFALNSEDGINYDLLTERIIKKEEIDSTVIQNEHFSLAHLFLFMNSNGYTLLNDNYEKQAYRKWTNNGISEKNSLNSALQSFLKVRLLYSLDKYNEAKPLFDEITNNKTVPNSYFKYKILRFLDYTLYSQGYYDLSLEIVKNLAAPLTRYLGDKKSELSTLSVQAAYSYHIGKINAAQEVNLEILEISESSGIPVNRTTVYNNLGLTYKKRGEFSKYLNLQLKALQEANNEDKTSRRLEILSNLYLYYTDIKDFETAILYLNEAKKLAEEYDNSVQVGKINMYLGILYRDFENNFEKSLSYFEKAKNYLDPNKDYLFYLQLLDEKALLYERMGEEEISKNIYYTKAELSKSKDKVKFLEANLAIIDLELKADRLESAKSLLDTVKSYDLTQLDFKNIIKAKTVEAQYLLAKDQSNEAYQIMKPAIQRVVERARSSTDLQSGFWNVDEQYLDAFSLMADLLIKTGRNEEGVEVLDKLKTINDASLYQNPMVKSSLLDETELLQYQKLTGQLDALRKKLLLASEKEQLSLQSRIEQLTAQKNVLDRKISDMVDQEPVSVKEVQRRITGRELVLHITELQDQYYIARISRHEVNFNKVELDSTLRSKFSSAIDNLSIGKTDINELSEISDILDIGSIPSWIDRLTIIPDSYLYQLPIDALPIKSEGFGYSYGGATYVVEKYKTHYLTSLNDFRPNNSPRRKYKLDFAGYGVSQFPSYTNKENLVPLPHAESEVSTIVGNLSNMATKQAYLDTASTEKVFKETASGARILHLATHSELSERDPLFSTIYMSADRSTDNEEFSGQIFAYELFELNLANDLIMLNSCESGSGSYLQGTGVMGISRALRYAGANSLILNLWSVNDMMASDFAVEFYKNINEGQTKDEALRQAKLHFLKNKNANPHYWGPYILIGNRDALVNPNRETNIYFAGAFMLFFITVASISLLHDRKDKAA